MLQGFDPHFLSIHNLHLKRNVFYSTLFRAVLVNLYLAKVDFFQWKKKKEKEYHQLKMFKN